MLFPAKILESAPAYKSISTTVFMALSRKTVSKIYLSNDMYARLHWILVTSLISYRILSSAESILNGYWKKKPTTTTAHYRSVLVVDCLWNGNKLLFTRTDFSFFQKNRENLKYVYTCYNNYYYQFWQYKLLLKIITCSYQAECGSWPTGLQTKDIQMWFKNVKLTWLLATLNKEK